MRPLHLTGSKQEIAQNVSRMAGDVHEAIVFVDEPGGPTGTNGSRGKGGEGEDIFAEMEPFTVKRPDADDSREAIYRRNDGE